MSEVMRASSEPDTRRPGNVGSVAPVQRTRHPRRATPARRALRYAPRECRHISMYLRTLAASSVDTLRDGSDLTNDWP